MLLNWFVFVPVLLALLLVPRMWASIVLRAELPAIDWAWRIGFIGAVVALSYIALNLPSSSDYSTAHSEKRFKVKQGPFIFGSLIWLVLSASALSVYLLLLGNTPRPWSDYAEFAAGIVVIPWLLCIVKVLWGTARAKKRAPIFQIIFATVIIGLIQIIVGFIASAAVILVLPVFDDRGIAYSIFSTPLVLLLMAFEAVLITGLTSRVSSDEDRKSVV